MSGYAPEFTSRYRLRYRANGANYSATFRFAGNLAAPTTTFVSAIGAFYNSLAVFRWVDWEVLGADYAQQGSVVFLPSTAPAVNAGQATTTGRTLAYQSVNLSFGGRSALNNAARFFVYGVNIDPINNATTNQDFRLTAAESSTIASALAALNGIASEGWVASDGLPVSFVNGYANIGISAYRQRKLRAGG
jgi:hypothetical protein